MRTDLLGALYDPDTERGVLNALMSRPEYYGAIEPRLHPGLFTEPDCVAVFKALRKGYDSQQGVLMTATDVMRVLMASGHEPGEAGRLVAGICSGGASTNLDIDVAWLADLAVRRKLIEAASRLGVEAADMGSDVADVLEGARKAIDRIENIAVPETSQVETLSDAFEQLKERMKANLYDDAGVGTPTGFAELDRRGGLLSGHLVIVGGKTSQGKSSLATNICVNALRSGAPTAYYTLEMSSQEEGARILAAMTGIPTGRILNDKLGSPEIDAVYGAMERIDGKLMYFDQRVSSTTDGIIRSIRELHRRYGIRGAVVDFLQRLSYASNVPREQAVAEAAKKFKNVARELDIWVMVLSQINRGVKGTEAPDLSGLRDSGQIEEAADEVWLLYRPEAYGPEARFPAPFERESTRGRAMIRIAKGRNTGTGEFLCNFNPSTCSFSECEASDPFNDNDNNDDLF